MERDKRKAAFITSKTVATTAASLAVLTACTTAESGVGTPAQVGRFSSHSNLRFTPDAKNQKYIDCKDANAAIIYTLDQDSSAITLGESTDGPSSTTVHLLGGLTIRSLKNGTFEFARSDYPVGDTTTIASGSDKEPIPVPGESGLLVTIDVSQSVAAIAVTCLNS